MPVQHITVFGATGSIGDSTLDIIASHPERYQIYALSAFSRMDKLAAIAHYFAAKVVVVPDEQARQKFMDNFAVFKSHVALPEIRLGEAGLCETARDPASPTVVCAIVGAAGLPSAYAAAQAGKKILLANKEVLVSAGALFMQAVAESGAQLLPLDSEHNAIFQCMPADLSTQHVKKLILTASGGPFRQTPLAELSKVTPAQACKHPNWDMGRKISIDSATMLNKGLEVIEAKWLFNVSPENIDVVIHPQSTIHSLVQYIDGSLLAQLGNADMRIPISYALAYPERIAHKASEFNLSDLVRLDFQAPDYQRYPCLGLAFQALKAGLAECAALNAANEVAVDAFLNGQIGFTRIAQMIEHVLNQLSMPSLKDIDHVLEFDAHVRRVSQAYLPKVA